MDLIVEMHFGSHLYGTATAASDLDFKAVYITLPLPYAAEILAIKRGECAYEAVAETIEALLVAVETAAATSSLREAPDQEFIDAFLLRIHRAKVFGPA